MLTLRPYQQEAVAAIYEHLRTRDDNPCAVLPTGSGKTPILAQICSDTAEKWHGRILVLSHVKELLEQAAAHLASFLPINMVGLHSAGLGRRDTTHPVIVAGIQTVAAKAGDLGAFDLIIVDECFPAGTLIKTPNGEIAIECLRVGQHVCNALGVGKIEAISARNEKELLEICLDDGERIVCTRNHPFFTSSGWVEARRLEKGARLFSHKDMQMLRARIQAVDCDESGRDPSLIYEGALLEKAAILFNILRQEMRECDDESGGPRENEENIEANASCTDTARRERFSFADTATSPASRPWSGMGSGTCGDDRHSAGQSNPAPLQDRYSESGGADCNRIGRSEPLHGKSASGGYSENNVFDSKRVAGIAPVKQDCPTPVFNLHVSKHPSYYAGGVLVHNCHLIPEAGEGRYLTFLRDAKIVNPAVRVVGLTATPFRLGTGMVCRSGNIMNHICYEANVKELILAGWLSPLRTRQGGEVASLSGVKIASTGDFDASEMQDAFAAITAAACREITELCRERRSALVFAAGARHAGLVAATLGGEIVTGSTPKEERAGIIARFRAGRIKYLVNVNVLTTGFDAPNVDAVVLLRATMSAGLYCQMVGRGLRKSPGKTDCLVLDYGGNAVRHGPIDRISVIDKKKKSGPAEDAPGKLCPNCREVISVQYRVCPVCAFEFPAREKPRHEARAGDAPILSGEAEAKTQAVRSVRYYEHSKIKEDGTSVTMRVEYVINEIMHRTIMEFLCFDHPIGSKARRKAEAWWRERSSAPVPGTVMDAVAMARRGALAEPRTITTIREDGEKYARIVGYDMGEIPFWEAPDDDGNFFAAEDTGAADANDMPF